MLQVISNDRFVSPLHRVLAQRSSERFSAPFFLNPPYELDCTPAPGAGEEPHYAPLNWGEFRRRRFEGDFADNGVETQISGWRRRGAPSMRHLQPH